MKTRLENIIAPKQESTYHICNFDKVTIRKNMQPKQKRRTKHAPERQYEVNVTLGPVCHLSQGCNKLCGSRFPRGLGPMWLLLKQNTKKAIFFSLASQVEVNISLLEAT